MANNSVLPDYDYFSTAYQPTFKGYAVFELRGWIGRTFQNKKAPNATGKENLLHLGCGKNIFEGWVNADFFGSLFKRTGHTARYDWELDIRYPFNCPDNFWDGVFTEHTLEHLYPNEVKLCLTEVYRTLKPGGWVRIVVPDVEKYIQNYIGNRPDPKFGLWATGCEAIRCLTQNYFHHSVWDGQFFSKVLSDLGYRNVKVVSFKQGTDERLLRDMEDRKWESLYLEAQK